MNSYAPPDTGISPYARNLDYIKSFFKRPLVLVIAVLYTASIPVGVLQTMQFLSYIVNTSQRQLGITAAQASRVYTLFFAAMGACYLFPVLYAVGFWLIYLKSRSQNSASSPNAGFTLLFVLTIIEMVLLGIAAVGLLFFLNSSDFSAYMQYYLYTVMEDIDPSTAQAVLGVFSVLVVIIVAVAYLYLIAKLRFVNSVRRSSRNVLLQSKGVILFAVLTVFSCLSYLTSLSESLSSSSGTFSQADSLTALQLPQSPWMIVNILLLLAMNVCLVVLAFSYHSYVNRTNSFIYSTMPPQYPTYANPYGQPYQPQPFHPPYPQQPPVNTPPEPFTNPYQTGPSAQPAPPQEAAQTEPDEEDTPAVCPGCGLPVTRSMEECPHCGRKFHP